MNDRNKTDKRRPAAPAKDDAAQPERIAKRLARAGVASRREAEALIADGRVKVNGKVLDSPAFNVTAADRIEIDDEPIPAVERTRLFLFHKPAGVVTTNRDPEGRRTVFDVLPEGLPRLITVGRLDINTEGLLLLTNDGGLARVLELPQTGWMRRYRVRVHGEVDEGALAGLKDGIAVDGVFYGSIEAALDRRQGTNSWLTVGLREGKNREVKNVMAALGLEVTRLIRVSFGPFQLGELEEGQVRELRGRMLRDQLGPRLIEEAGANFDAPIVTHFQGGADAGSERIKPREDAPRRERAERPAPRVEEGGLVRNRKRDRADSRDTALSRLSTSAPRGARGDKPFGGKPRGEKGERREEAPRKPRTANVWMAPGARPVPEKKDGEERVVKVARKPGDRKAKHDAASKRYRPGRAERAAGEQPGERPKREWKPGAEGAERPKREWKPRAEGAERPKRDFRQGEDAPRRDWKAKPPRPGKFERAAAKETGEAPQREYRPRPKPRDGEAAPPRRPRAEGAERRPYEKRDGKPAGRSFDRKQGGKQGAAHPGGSRGGPRKGPSKGSAKGPPKGPRGGGRD